MTEINLTSFSHGAGCGCKLSPSVLSEILAGAIQRPDNAKLLVGNDSRDDAAVYELMDEVCLISTTDFFMPIVNDPFDFGRIASANAISDVYAMGGKPILALAILGWPMEKISSDIAKKVLDGARKICAEAGIVLAGGHSIDAPEPIFGLAVNGLVKKGNIKRNNTAIEGDQIYLTKKIGVGILATAEKRGVLLSEDVGLATKQMVELNDLGEKLAEHSFVHAMTDVTGFGLLGHLLEMAEGSGLGVRLNRDKVPRLSQNLGYYIDNGGASGGLQRNWDSYKNKIIEPADWKYDRITFCDPQTSGGLMITVDNMGVSEMEHLLIQDGKDDMAQPIGTFVREHPGMIKVL